MAAIIWCGASAPVVQGFLVGLGVVTTGLVLFPFDFRISRPNGGKMLPVAQARTALRWSTRVSWLLVALTVLTIAGYVVIFVSANGRFCGASLSATTEHLVIAWAAVTGLTVVTLAMSAWLRRRARKANSS